ncbi:MAG: hypothetical protein PHW60_14735 [Kiritimatiellae bacterium]|nr:hypothetical protein [Kiritimatiellia bacterium]
MMNQQITIDHEEEQEAKIESLRQMTALLQDRIALLEEENASYAAMLKERGVDVRSRSQIALELPPALTRPLDATAAVFALLTPAQRTLLDAIRGTESVFMLLKSDTLVDTGGWFRRSNIWVCALPRELALFAQGRKPFLQKTPYEYLRASIYNHVTAEVVLSPSRGLKQRTLKVPPAEGYQLLSQIYNPNPKGV